MSPDIYHFPYVVDSPLTAGEVVKHWSREHKEQKSGPELMSELVKAWWLGHLRVAEEPPRLYVLKQLYCLQRDSIAFVVETNPFVLVRVPDDGDDRRPRVRVPTSDISLWTDATCHLAYDDMAEQCGTMPGSVTDLLRFPEMRVHAFEFRNYLHITGFRSVIFWHARDTTPRHWIPPDDADNRTQLAHPSNRTMKEIVQVHLDDLDAKGLSRPRVTQALVAKIAKTANLNPSRVQMRATRDIFEENVHTGRTKKNSP